MSNPKAEPILFQRSAATFTVPEWQRTRRPDLPADMMVQYEIHLDPNGLRDLIYRAALNKSRKAQDGPITVTAIQVREAK